MRYSQLPGAVTLPERRFLTPPSWSSGEWTTDYGLGGLVPVGDLNGDGFGDVLLHVMRTDYQRVAIRDMGDILHLFAGGPSGLSSRFQVLWSRSVFPFPPGLLVCIPIGDRDGDGYADVAVRHGEASTETHVIRYGGRTLTRAGEGLPFLPTVGLWHLIGDFNADGRSDDVTASGVDGAPSVSGCGAPTDARGPFRGVVADANDDGFDDLDSVWGRGADAVHILFLGGPDGLSPTRCTRLP